MAIRPLITLTFYVIKNPKTGIDVLFAAKKDAAEWWHQTTGGYRNGAPIRKISFVTKRDFTHYINSEIAFNHDRANFEAIIYQGEE